MNIFLIGGTGLIGSAAARELIARGHAVRAIALAPVPENASLPASMTLSFASYLDLSDEEWRDRLSGCEGLVFAAGIDDRIEGPPPIEDRYRKYNITPLQRILAAARACGVRHVVVCGSYFCHFDRTMPDLQLSLIHPYIRSRIEQERMALGFAGECGLAPGTVPAEGMDVSILELPYIFGAQPGRKPVWLFLIRQIRRMPAATFYPGGGSAMVTVRQVGQAIAGALERNRGGHAYPIGWSNLTWREMLAIMHRHMGQPHKPVVTIPDWTSRMLFRVIGHRLARRGLDPGLRPVAFAQAMTRNLFIAPELGCKPLGVEPDDIDAAIGESVRLCLDILQGQPAIDMRGE